MSISWIKGAISPVHCAFHTAVLHQGKMYIGRGNKSIGQPCYRIDTYSLADNKWSRSPICISYKYFAIATLNNEIIVTGGKDKNGKVTNRIFLLQNEELNEYTKMISSRYLATVASYQKTLIVVGGRNDHNETISSTELFDSSTAEWYTADNLSVPHSELKSVIVDNLLYLLGGLNQDGYPSQAVFCTPLDTLSSHQLNWSSQQDTPWCRSAPVSIEGRNLLAIGGWKKVENVCTNKIYILNKISHNWKVIGQIPSPRDGLAAVSLAKNSIVLVGGYNDDREYTNTVWIGSF